jgi:protein-L-isoaspartate(D-aspartate) O-methyltransferase
VGLGSLLGSAGLPAGGFGQVRDPFLSARLRMVETEIAREGITNPAVLNALRQVPRHLFVSPDQIPKAYIDQALPIGHKQTITPPFLVAYMTEALDPQPTDRVLEIGTGSGYQAAVLARIVKEVYSIEIIEPLGKHAAKRLRDLGYLNVRTKIGDGYLGWPEHAPFDKIIVTCSPSEVPKPLVEQLREGGKMIIPVGESFQQVFYLLEKRDGQLVQKKLLPTLFVPMTGIANASRKDHADLAHPHLVNGGFEQHTDGQPDGWYYVRQAALAFDHAPEGDTYLTLTNHDPGHSAMALQGVGIDGARVKALRFSLVVKAENVQFGTRRYERPMLSVHFFSIEQRPLGDQVVGPWEGSFSWRTVAGEVLVPPQAHWAVVRIGLNGATGRLSVDDIRLKPVPRKR